MKIALTFILSALISLASSALLQTNSQGSKNGSASSRRLQDWISKNLTKHNVSWGLVGAGVGGTAGYLYNRPENFIYFNTKKFGRKLKFEQTLLTTRINQNRQIINEIDEVVSNGNMVLDDLENEALRKVQTLRSDVELKFKH